MKAFLTNGCENCRCKEDGLNVTPLVDALLRLQVDSFLGRDRNGLFVFEQFVVDVFAVNDGIPTSVENESNEILSFHQYLISNMLIRLLYLDKLLNNNICSTS